MYQPRIKSVEKKNITLNSISLKVNALNGSNDVVKYYYSKDNGLTYIASDENTFTFDNLLDPNISSTLTAIEYVSFSAKDKKVYVFDVCPSLHVAPSSLLK